MNTKVKEIVLKSLIESDKDVTLARIAHLLKESDIDCLTSGVIINAEIKDDDLVIDNFNEKDVFLEDFKVVRVTPIGVVSILYTFREKQHFATQAQADEYNAGKDVSRLSRSQYTENDIVVPSRWQRTKTIEFSYEDAKAFCNFEVL